eukprot:TRINITY_DN64970_c0_g1_i1.p1 TRINITY_DN64970_c0_g1~~TRINITY_DN64970_c0_g1_i1.p1  ORF type:complete len:157 (+),score=27.78 TRINITY_DN64970_c0_g1_i1:57-473(+)
MTAYDEGVHKEVMWLQKWAQQAADDRLAGRTKEPSRWVIGPWRRPVQLSRAPQTQAFPLEEELSSRPTSEGAASSRSRQGSRAASASSRSLQRPSSEASLSKMRTSHMMTEMKRNFSIETSVLGSKFTPAHKISRRMY